MNTIKIRPLEPADMVKMRHLVRTRHDLDDQGAQRRTQLMDWIAFNNPFANGETTYFVAEEDANLVAYLGRMPTEFIVGGKIQRAYFIHDLYVHKEYRKKGMGLFLSMALSEALEKDSKSFICGVWTSPFTLLMQKRRGYYSFDADKYVKFINPYPQLKKYITSEPLLKIASLAYRALISTVDCLLLMRTSSDIQISRVHRFDNTFDNLVKDLIPKLGISVFKTSAYLNWKFLDRPYSQSVVFMAQKKNRLLGFLILDITNEDGYPRGVIADITADPTDTKTINALLKTGIRYLRKAKVYSIDTCFTDEALIRAIKRFLFLTTSYKKEPVTLGNLQKCQTRNYITNINNWNLTYSASDGLMLMDQISQSLHSQDQIIGG